MILASQDCGSEMIQTSFCRTGITFVKWKIDLIEKEKESKKSTSNIAGNIDKADTITNITT